MAVNIALHNDMLASSVMMRIKDAYGYTDQEFYDKYSISRSTFHYHGGASPSIAWNDVQEIQSFNKYTEHAVKIKVPDYPTEGYNQHSHTSEFDGGAIAGLIGVHTHKSSKQADGGLCFAVFHPSTQFVVEWE